MKIWNWLYVKGFQNVCMRQKYNVWSNLFFPNFDACNLKLKLSFQISDGKFYESSCRYLKVFVPGRSSQAGCFLCTRKYILDTVIVVIGGVSQMQQMEIWLEGAGWKCLYRGCCAESGKVWVHVFWPYSLLCALPCPVFLYSRISWGRSGSSVLM